MAQIGDAISSPFQTGEGSIGCFLTGNFFGINGCVVALTAAHVLFSHESDFSAKSFTRGTAKETTKSGQAVNAERANEFLGTKGTLNTRDDVCRWALNDENFKNSAKSVFDTGGPPQDADYRKLFKPTLKPARFWVPFTKRALSETDWGVAMASTGALWDNTPIAVPAGVTGSWSGWREPLEGDKLFKYGKTSKLTEGKVSIAPDARGFTAKATKTGQKFSDEGDSGAGVFAIENDGNYSLVGIISKGGATGTSVLRMDYIAGEIRSLYGFEAEKA